MCSSSILNSVYHRKTKVSRIAAQFSVGMGKKKKEKKRGKKRENIPTSGRIETSRVGLGVAISPLQKNIREKSSVHIWKTPGINGAASPQKAARGRRQTCLPLLDI